LILVGDLATKASEELPLGIGDFFDKSPDSGCASVVHDEVQHSAWPSILVILENWPPMSLAVLTSENSRYLTSDGMHKGYPEAP
jgi:hypothetical protein